MLCGLKVEGSWVRSVWLRGSGKIVCGVVGSHALFLRSWPRANSEQNSKRSGAPSSCPGVIQWLEALENNRTHVGQALELDTWTPPELK
jgi:hypothetical protein